MSAITRMVPSMPPIYIWLSVSNVRMDTRACGGYPSGRYRTYQLRHTVASAVGGGLSRCSVKHAYAHLKPLNGDQSRRSGTREVRECAVLRRCDSERRMPVASAIIGGVDTSETAAVIKSTLAAEQLTTLACRVSLPCGVMRPRRQWLLGFSPRTVGTMEPLCRPPVRMKSARPKIASP
jgi:hypothetical protein